MSHSPAGCFVTHHFRNYIPTEFSPCCFCCCSVFLHWFQIKCRIFNNSVWSVYQPAHYTVKFDICLCKDLYLFMSWRGINFLLFIPFSLWIFVWSCLYLKCLDLVVFLIGNVAFRAQWVAFIWETVLFICLTEIFLNKYCCLQFVLSIYLLLPCLQC